MLINKLKYTQKWLDYGLIDDETIAEQTLLYEKGEDPYTEHYRFAAFKKYLLHKNTLSDAHLAQCLEVLAEEPDRTMAASVVQMLFPLVAENPKQSNKVEAQFVTFGDWTTKILERKKLFQSLKNIPMNEALLQACLANGDKMLLLQCITLSANQPVLLELLAKNAPQKSVRQMAIRALKPFQK